LLPALVAILVVPDSFAGERERHTLETLLASSLPDKAILYGKMGAPVFLGWGVTLIALLSGLLTVNIVHWDGQLMLYSPTIAMADVFLSGLIATLASGAGVLVSLRATSVQEAIQALTVAFMLSGMALGALLLIVGAVVAPRFRDGRTGLHFGQFVLIAVVVIVLLDVIVLFAAKIRFRRARLILR
jgi:ABC-2 type transport system permease protein